MTASNWRFNQILFSVKFYMPPYFSKCFQERNGKIPDAFLSKIRNTHKKQEDIDSVSFYKLFKLNARQARDVS